MIRTLLQLIILFDALPPGIVGGGMLVAAAVARHRRRAWGARLFEFGGLVAILLSLLIVDGVGQHFVCHSSVSIAYQSFAVATYMFFGAKVISAIVIGGISWRADRAVLAAQPNSPFASSDRQET